MTSRRHFLQSAAALSATPLAPKVVFADGREPVALDAIIIDSRHRDARTFGLRTRGWGAPLRQIEGDITNLWRNDLLARWESGPGAVAGLTERPALFLLERLAWDHGLRVVFEAEHAPDGQGAAAHRVLRTADTGLKGRLEAAGAGWPAVLADTLIVGSRTAARDFRPSDAAMASHAGEPTKLYSWIIAPRSAV